MCSQATATMAAERSPSAISHTRRNHGWCRRCTKQRTVVPLIATIWVTRCRQPSGHVVFRNDPTSISSWIFLDDESHRRFVWKGIPPSAAGLETGSVSFLQMHVEALIRLGLNVKTLRRGVKRLEADDDDDAGGDGHDDGNHRSNSNYPPRKRTFCENTSLSQRGVLHGIAKLCPLPEQGDLIDQVHARFLKEQVWGVSQPAQKEWLCDAETICRLRWETRATEQLKTVLLFTRL